MAAADGNEEEGKGEQEEEEKEEMFDVVINCAGGDAVRA